MRGLRVVIRRLGLLGLMALTGGAAAADMPVKAPPPPPAPVWTWTGFYIGGSVGGIGTGLARSLDEARGAVSQVGLIEDLCHRRSPGRP